MAFPIVNYEKKVNTATGKLIESRKLIRASEFQYQF